MTTLVFALGLLATICLTLGLDFVAAATEKRVPWLTKRRTQVVLLSALGAQLLSVIWVYADGVRTAGKVRKPEVTLREVAPTKLEEGVYLTRYQLEVDSEVPVPNIYVRAAGPGIGRLTVGAASPDSLFERLGHVGMRSGYNFQNLRGARGLYAITIVSNDPTKPEVTANIGPDRSPDLQPMDVVPPLL